MKSDEASDEDDIDCGLDALVLCSSNYYVL